MELKITGVDEAIQAMEELRDAISPETLVRWADAIEQTALAKCGKSAAFKGSIDEQGKFSLEFRLTESNYDCLIEAIKENTPSMHQATKAFYDNVIVAIMTERAKRLAPAQTG